MKSNHKKHITFYHKLMVRKIIYSAKYINTLAELNVTTCCGKNKQCCMKTVCLCMFTNIIFWMHTVLSLNVN